MGKPFRECPDCGAHLDAGETCDCKQEARPVERVQMTLVAICRETDPDTGEISVFKVDARADNRLLTELTAIVAKTGFMIGAIILPYDEVFSDRFVSELNTLAQECRWTYEHPRRPVEEPEAEGQTGLFKVDKETGEVISGPDAPAAEGEAE